MSDSQTPPDAGNHAPSGPPAGGASAVSGERHVSEVAGRGPIISKRAGIGVIIAGAAIACGVILLTSTRPNLRPDDGPKLAVQPQVQYVPPPPPTTLPAVQAPPVPTPPLPAQAAASAPAPAAAPRPQARLLVYTSGASNAARSGQGAGLMSPGPYGDASAAPGAADGLPAGQGIPVGLMPSDGSPSPAGAPLGGGTLASRLTPTRLTGVSASVLQHQPFLLTTGTLIPCVLQTAMDSTLPGLVTCVVPQDILGKTGLTLLDRGTRVVGEFKGGITQGVERMFVVWTRAETPQGVVISLDSPATDPLGRSGMDGEVDRHFWQRFGGALLLSTVDGAIQAGVAAASSSGNTYVNTGSTESVVSESLRGTINIPPTIRKNQGELVSIFVARDLDFATVYGVQPTPPRYVRASENGGR